MNRGDTCDSIHVWFGKLSQKLIIPYRSTPTCLLLCGCKRLTWQCLFSGRKSCVASFTKGDKGGVYYCLAVFSKT